MFIFACLKPAARVDQGTLAEMVKPSIDYVRHKRFRSGNYPSSLSNETDRLVHWCHGAPGVLHMLLQAHEVGAPPLPQLHVGGVHFNQLKLTPQRSLCGRELGGGPGSRQTD